MKEWLPRTPPLTADDFYKIIVLHPHCVIHFWATWNYIDRDYDVDIQEVKKEFELIKFFSFNIDPEEGWPICREYKITNVPALVRFNSGEYQETLIGRRSVEELRERFTEWINRTA